MFTLVCTICGTLDPHKKVQQIHVFMYYIQHLLNLSFSIDKNITFTKFVLENSFWNARIEINDETSQIPMLYKFNLFTTNIVWLGLICRGMFNLSENVSKFSLNINAGGLLQILFVMKILKFINTFLLLFQLKVNSIEVYYFLVGLISSYFAY